MTDIHQLIADATQEEIENLGKIFGCPPERERLFGGFQSNSQNKIVWLFASDKSYYTLLKQVAENCKVGFVDGETEDVIEKRILDSVMKSAFEKMTDAQKKDFESRIKEEYRKSGREYNFAGSAAWVTGILAAQMSGFGVYLLSSIALSTVSRALGLSLGFAAYSGASSAIAFLIGPVGWALAGAFTIISLTGPNNKKLLLGMLQLIGIKARLQFEVESSSENSSNSGSKNVNFSDKSANSQDKETTPGGRENEQRLKKVDEELEIVHLLMNLALVDGMKTNEERSYLMSRLYKNLESGIINRKDFEQMEFLVNSWNARDLNYRSLSVLVPQKTNVVGYMIDLAKCDGPINQKEEAVIFDVAAHFGFSRDTVRPLIAKHQ